MKSPRVITDPAILDGTPVFAGTRVPVRALFEFLARGDPLDLFLEDFPSVSRKLAVQVLADANQALEAQTQSRRGASQPSPAQATAKRKYLLVDLIAQCDPQAAPPADLAL